MGNLERDESSSGVLLVIDPTKEKLFLVAKLDQVPWMKQIGRKIHRSVGHRWAKDGVGGVVLETIKIGGRRYTSEEALLRFVQKTSRPESNTTELSAQRSKQIEATRRRNFEAGIGDKVDRMKPNG